jgi:hypothetical protein
MTMLKYLERLLTKELIILGGSGPILQGSIMEQTAMLRGLSIEEVYLVQSGQKYVTNNIYLKKINLL